MKTVSLLLFVWISSSCVSSPTSGDSPSPADADSETRSATASALETSGCETATWHTWGQALSSTTQDLLIHDFDLSRVSVDGTRVWLWTTARERTLDNNAKRAISAGPLNWVGPAEELRLSHGRVIFFVAQYLGVLDVASGEEIYVDRRFRDPKWEVEVLRRGESQLSSNRHGVRLAGPSGTRQFHGAELYSCGMGEIVFVATRGGELLKVDERGNASAAGRAKNAPGAAVVAFYVDMTGTIERVWTDGSVVADRESCWDISSRPDEIPVRIWEDVRPTAVAVTRHGYAVHLQRPENGTGKGPIMFLPFGEARDLQICRRVTKRLVLPPEADQR